MADVLTQIYNAIDPFQPLEPDDPAYVDCQAERGDTDVVVGLGREIIRSDRYTCQLFAGHRGGQENLPNYCVSKLIWKLRAVW